MNAKKSGVADVHAMNVPRQNPGTLKNTAVTMTADATSDVTT